MLKFIRASYGILAVLSSLFLLSCAEKPEEKPKEKKEDTTQPRLVGRVASIPASRKFVLIQAYGNWKVETGAILTTQGPEGRAANLRATGEKLGQYAAADIQSGTLETGDGVYTVAKMPELSGDPEEEEEEVPPANKEPAPSDAEPPKDQGTILDDTPQ